MSTAEKRSISPQEYLAIERVAEIRHEFYNGEMFAMSGATRGHNLIAGNTFATLRGQLVERQCEVYQSDMRVKVESTGLYTYPDVVVACHPEFEDEQLDTLINPCVIVDVLSKSTEDYDRGTKFEMYRRLPSLQDYMLVAQHRLHVEHFQRQPDGRWILEEFDSPERTIAFESCGCNLRVEDIYTRITFADES